VAILSDSETSINVFFVLNQLVILLKSVIRLFIYFLIRYAILAI